MKKPEPRACRVCGKPAAPFLLPAIKGFSAARWMTPVECASCEAKIEANQREADHERQLAEKLKLARMDAPYFAGARLDRFKKDTPARVRVADMARPVVERLRSIKRLSNLLLSGNSGAGKTFLAGALAREAMSLGQRAVYWSWPELCLEMREADKKGLKMALIASILQHDVFVLDDVGAEKASEFVAENLYLLVNKVEMANRGGMIVTTNLTLQRLGEIYADRIASRLVGLSIHIDYDGCADGRLERRKDP